MGNYKETGTDETPTRRGKTMPGDGNLTQKNGRGFYPDMGHLENEGKKKRKPEGRR